jgi:NAD-dependent SIR2 family protein deacetylase
LFECLHVSCQGTIKVWKCRGCKKNFYTKKG